MPNPSPSPTRLMIPSPGPTTWDVIAQWVAIGLLTTGTLIFIAFVIENLLFSDKKREIKPFYLWIAAIAFFGGLLSFFLPIAINSGFGKDDDGPVLRQLILYTTGGVLGVITLGETHRKNNQEKEKNENDHIRQVHTERRSRYAKAIEQLANEKATIRLGGIYTLVGLVDEWLDDSYTNRENKLKEGQLIINNLCAYIRSPFPLAGQRYSLEQEGVGKKITRRHKGDFLNNKSALQEEQEVRRTIFKEISERVSAVDKEYNLSPGKWSRFTFNFKKSTIFYSLDNLNFENADFRNSQFYGKANFFNSVFSGTTFFINTIFHGEAVFSNSVFFPGTDAIKPYEAYTPETPNEFPILAGTSQEYLSALFNDATFMVPPCFSGAVFWTFQKSATQFYNISSEYKFSKKIKFQQRPNRTKLFTKYK